MSIVPRIFPAILALLALTPGVGAQSFSGGLRLGTSVSTLRTDGPLEMGLAAGLSGGVWVDVPFRGGLSLQSGVTYLSAGANATARAGDVFDAPADPEQPVRLRFSYTYLQVPLQLAYEPPLRRTLSPRVFAGPYVAFNQDAFVRYGVEGGTLGNAESDRNVNGRDYGVAFGGQVSFDTGAYGRFAVGAEASVGLADIRDAPVTASSNVQTTNLGVLLFVGVVF